MVPKVEGPEDIHYVDRLLAQLEARAGVRRPILVHALLETARGVANVEEICAASPRMQGLSLGPADLAADRRMKTTRVGGGHPDYLVRQDPVADDPDAARATYQQDLWHYTMAKMVDACVANGILPYYGPFGDIKDTVACEDQFRNAYLLGCVGAWSLHPVQIDIAKKVFSPDPAEVAWAARVIEAMGDGTGAVMIDGKMQDDATVKRCVVMNLARLLAEARRGPGSRLRLLTPPRRRPSERTNPRPRSPDDRRPPARRGVLYMPGANERALDKAEGLPADADPRPRGRRGPGRQGRSPQRVCAAVTSGTTAAGSSRSAPTVSTPSGMPTTHARRSPRRGRRRSISSRRSSSVDDVRAVESALEAASLPDHTKIWAMVETPIAMLHAAEIAAASDHCRARDGHQRPGQGAARRASPAASRC
ncbi:MAG: CoA ester lyase [Acidimicrobiales bacterium]